MIARNYGTAASGGTSVTRTAASPLVLLDGSVKHALFGSRKERADGRAGNGPGTAAVL